MDSPEIQKIIFKKIFFSASILYQKLSCMNATVRIPVLLLLLLIWSSVGSVLK